MALRRDGRTTVLLAGKQYGTSTAYKRIREGIANGRISLIETRQIAEGERLDSIAGRKYNGRSDLWWIIAAASNIGWGLQVSPGIEIKIPRLEDVADVVG